MNRDERELNYLFGEMTPDEMTAYEAEFGRGEEDLRGLLSDIKLLRDDVPEMQFSTERLRAAIDNSAQPGKTWFLPMRWVTSAGAVAACALAVLIYVRGGEKAIDNLGKEAIEKTTVAQAEPANAPAYELAPSFDVTIPGMPEAKSAAPHAAQKTASTIVRRMDRHISHRVPRPSVGSKIAGSPLATKSERGTTPMTDGPTSPAPSMDVTDMMPAGSGEGEAVIVVRTTPTGKSGVRAAVEKDSDDLVLGS